MIIKKLESTNFSENDQELARISEKIINKISDDSDSYFSKEDYEKLLNYYLNNQDEEGIKSMVCPAMINLLKRQPYFKLDERENKNKLHQIQLNLLIEKVKNGDIFDVKMMLNYSHYCKSIINKPLLLSEAREMVPGATLLHLALKQKNPEMAKLLISSGAKVDALDYYGNSVQHYGAMGGAESYNFAKKINNFSSKNIFGHTADDYLNNDHLERINHGMLTKKFISYIKLNKYDKNILTTNQFGNELTANDLATEMSRGICSGDGFIRAINIVSGKASTNLHEKMRNLIRHWDESAEALDQSLDDPDLVEEFSNLPNPTLRNVFEYLMSIMIASQQYPEIPIIDIKKSDRVKMFGLLKNGDDNLNYGTQIDAKIDDKETLKNELRKLLVTPNTIIELFVGGFPGQRYGHAIFIVTDENQLIHFIDPNTPYAIDSFKNEAAVLDTISNIVFSYYNNVKSITCYEYVPASEQNLRQNPK